MEKEFIEEMKNLLITEKKEIMNRLSSNNSDIKQIIESIETKDDIDIASDAIDGSMLDAIGTKELNKIKLIDSALTRIEQGRYGICVKCGKKIAEDRLRVLPYALMCIECKSAEERRNR